MNPLVVIPVAIAVYFGLLVFVVALCRMAARGDAHERHLHVSWTRERQLTGRSARLARATNSGFRAADRSYS
jgi:hypothetical protein